MTAARLVQAADFILARIEQREATDYSTTEQLTVDVRELAQIVKRLAEYLSSREGRNVEREIGR